MPGMTDYLEKAVLDSVFSNAAFPSNATLYIGLYSVMPADDGTGGTEFSGGSYARVAVTNNATQWPAATGGAPSTKTHANAISFATATADWGTAIGWGVFDASTGGNALYTGLLLTGSRYPGTADASSETLRAPGSAFTNGDRVVLEAIEGSSLPTGLSANTIYYIISASADTFQLSMTSGGSAINVTADGDFVIAKQASKTISSGDTASFAAGALVVSLA